MDVMQSKKLRKISRTTGIALDKIAQWHFVHSPHFISKHTGRPKGKVARPEGMLSVGDIKKKYNLKNATLARWREEGLAAETRGSLILIREAELAERIRGSFEL